MCPVKSLLVISCIFVIVTQSSNTAVDFVCKPSGSISIDIKKVQKELVDKIKAASNIDMSKLAFKTPADAKAVKTQKKTKAAEGDHLVIIATSTGGPRALAEVVPALSRDIPAAFIIVQHMSEGFTKTLAERLNASSLLPVKEAEQGDELKTGRVYLAPGNYHLEIKKDKNSYFVDLNQRPVRLGVRPSADITLFSAAKVFKGRITAVVLTGMGKDGSAGAEKIKEKGGYVIAQDKESSVIFGMPKAVIEKKVADKVAPLDRIAPEIAQAVKNEAEAV